MLALISDNVVLQIQRCVAADAGSVAVQCVSPAAAPPGGQDKGHSEVARAALADFLAGAFRCGVPVELEQRQELAELCISLAWLGRSRSRLALGRLFRFQYIYIYLYIQTYSMGIYIYLYSLILDICTYF